MDECLAFIPSRLKLGRAERSWIELSYPALRTSIVVGPKTLEKTWTLFGFSGQFVPRGVTDGRTDEDEPVVGVS